MSNELESCMLDLLHFLNRDSFKGIESEAASAISRKYSKQIIDKAAKELIDNGYTLGSESNINGKTDYFAQSITPKGIEYLQSHDHQ